MLHVDVVHFHLGRFHLCCLRRWRHILEVGRLPRLNVDDVTLEDRVHQGVYRASLLLVYLLHLATQALLG